MNDPYGKIVATYACSCKRCHTLVHIPPRYTDAESAADKLTREGWAHRFGAWLCPKCSGMPAILSRQAQIALVPEAPQPPDAAA